MIVSALHLMTNFNLVTNVEVTASFCRDLTGIVAHYSAHRWLNSLEDVLVSAFKLIRTEMLGLWSVSMLGLALYGNCGSIGLTHLGHKTLASVLLLRLEKHQGSAVWRQVQSWRNNCVQSYDTRSDETVIAARKEPDDQVLENLYFRQLDNADLLKQLLTLYILDRSSLLGGKDT